MRSSRVLSGCVLAAMAAAVLTWPGAFADEPPIESHEPSGPNRLTPIEGLTIDRAARQVEIRAWTCLEEGYLEQFACSPNTREHESLVVVRIKPSDIHGALLLAGYEPGKPGRWVHHEDGVIELIPPQGPRLEVLVRYRDGDGEMVEHPIRQWVRDQKNDRPFPDWPWVFGGSMIKPNPEFMGPGEHYVADMTGSIIGLVTFGDELLGLQQVISDQAQVHEPEWMVNTELIPPEGTEVTLILKPWPDEPAKEPSAQPSEAD